MSDTNLFFQNLPLYQDFAQLTNPACFNEIPSDWLIVVSDIESSTKAIATGKYKQVNALGASVIIAILNIVKPLQIPYVFGGDGASLCVPPEFETSIRSALLATKQLAKKEFDLNLRVGIVPLQLVIQQGFCIKVARYSVSPYYTQAVLMGGGITYVESLLKDKLQGALYRIESGEAQADFSGLECRWNTVPSRYGETISLLVKSKNTNELDAQIIYSDLLQKISEIYGSEKDCHPIHIANLKLTYNQKKLSVETFIRNTGTGFKQRLKYRLKLVIQNIIGQVLMGFKVKQKEVDWGQYQTNLIENTDCRKFDDMLRMIIAGNEQQRLEFTQYLDKQHHAGQLNYGLHVSKGALITCMVFHRQGEHIHFVDGAEGGYCQAALQLKAQQKK